MNGVFIVSSLRHRFCAALPILLGRYLALALFLLLAETLAHAQSGIALVQHAGKDAGTTTSSSLAFNSNNTTGNWIGVCIRAGAAGEAFAVADSKGNTYHRALQFDETGNGNTLGIFYAENIAGGANTITVSDTTLATLRFAIFEYSGVAPSSSLDVAVAAQGNSGSPNSGNGTTTANGDLLLGAIVTGSTATYTAGAGYRIEDFVPAEPGTKLIAEDQMQTTAGTASASASLGVANNWAAGLAAFKPASSGGTAPRITNLYPTSGPEGASVTITGTNFGTLQGSSSVTFNGTTATQPTWGPTSITVPVPIGATTGNVVVTVGGVASNGVGFTVLPATGGIALVQHAGKDAGTTTSSSLAFNSNNTTGNWIGVCIRAGAAGEAFAVADSKGNTYHRALQFNETGNGNTLGIFYAENIAGGANTITVSDTTLATLRFAIFEYSGVASSSSLDVAVAAQGNSGSPNSGNGTTTANGDLLLGAIVTGSPATYTAGAGYRIEDFVPAEPGTKLIAEDQMQTTAGTASASASLGVANNWAAGLAAFKPASSGPPPPISVSVSPTTANVPTGFGTQGFTATVQNDLQNKGATWSLSGSGCSGNSCGVLSNVTTTSVTYTAPANVPSPAAVTLTATSLTDNTKSARATVTVTQGSLNVAVSPKRSAVTMFQTQQFTATVFNDPLNGGVNWSVDGNIGGNATTGTVTSAGLFTPGSQPGQHTVTATSASNTSVSAGVTIAVTDLSGIFTQRYDNGRTGQNRQEYALNPATVNSATFGKLFSCPVDGMAYAQPLYVANLAISGGTHNVVYVATQHDSLYAFDADATPCRQFWKTSFINPGAGTTTVPSVDVSNGDIQPEVGITGTPVIDPASKTLYVVAKTKEVSGTTTNYFQRLHALDITTGVDTPSSPTVISPTYPGIGDNSSNGTVHFDALHQNQRPSLLLLNGVVYVAWASHGDNCCYHGWVVGYDATTLQQVSVYNVTPNGYRGGIWQSGTGLSADSAGNIYFADGNGKFDWNGTFPPVAPNNDFGDTVFRLSTSGGLTLTDFFTPFNQITLDGSDMDLGGGGVLVLPDQSGGGPAHIILAEGKEGKIFVINRDNLGKYNGPSGPDRVIQTISLFFPKSFLSTPLFWNNTLYAAAWGGPLRALSFDPTTGTFSVSNLPPQSADTFNYPGPSPAVSAQNTSNAIVWALDNSRYSVTATGGLGPTVLYAFDPNNLANKLYDSSQAANARDQAGFAVKFTVPTVANGKVYVGTQTELTVYGLLPN